MPPELAIRTEARPGGGRYVAELEGQEAELTWAAEGNQVRAALHVGVPRDIGGRGVGRALVARMVEDARAEEFRIRAVCPFVEAHRRRQGRVWADAFI